MKIYTIFNIGQGFDVILFGNEDVTARCFKNLKFVITHNFGPIWDTLCRPVRPTLLHALIVWTKSGGW